MPIKALSRLEVLVNAIYNLEITSEVAAWPKTILNSLVLRQRFF